MKRLDSRYNPYSDVSGIVSPKKNSIEVRASYIFNLIARHDMATVSGQEVRTLPTHVTAAFAKHIKALQKDVHTPSQREAVYDHLYVPLRDKIRRDNVTELTRQMTSQQLSETDRQELLCKIEDFEKKDFGAFNTIQWLMNFNGRDENRRVINGDELKAIHWLNEKIRKPMQREMTHSAPLLPVNRRLIFVDPRE